MLNISVDVLVSEASAICDALRAENMGRSASVAKLNEAVRNSTPGEVTDVVE